MYIIPTHFFFKLYMCNKNQIWTAMRERYSHFWPGNKPAPSALVGSCNAETPLATFAYLLLENYWTDLRRNTVESVVLQDRSEETWNSSH